MKKIFGLLFCILGAVIISGSMAQSARTTLDLRTGPIINSGDVSNLALVLSVEFPTTGAAYKNPNSYDSTKKYLGYWESRTCYAYHGTVADGYFQKTDATDANYNCNTGVAGVGTGFSGNFMNFAATSSIDILRLALTGGNRSQDTATDTILERANLLDETVSPNPTFYNNASNFPARTLTTTQSQNLTPFGAVAVTVLSCKNRVIFSSAVGGNCTTPTNLRTFNNTAAVSINADLRARVKVCDSAEGPVRTDLCKAYPNGSYKPVGEIQRNADKVRVAAFGYLLPPMANDNWYGGVLRAPMKFTGPNQKNSSGIVSTNSQAEWDSDTGVFVANPMSEASFANSGVINYLNKFGQSGNYKRHDPVGELYYESVRYFQGKQPTVDATAGYLPAYLDSYPIYTTWTDPMQTSCQRNYSLTIGDHQSAKDNYIPGVTAIGGETRSVDGVGVGALNAATWQDVVASFETNGSVSYVDSQGITRTANGNSTGNVTGVTSGNSGLSTKTQAGQAANGNNVGYAWAGVAYWANTQAIRSDKPLARIRTFVIDVNEGGQSITSPAFAANTGAGTGANHPIRQRALYLAGKYGGFSDVGPDGSVSTGEGNPFRSYVNGTLTVSDKEWLAADGSASPSGYFLASQPERVILAIRQIFAQASKPSGNIAGGALSVNRLNRAQTSGAFYQAQVDSTDWSGTLVRTALTYNTVTLTLDSNPTPVWDAANILTGIQTGTTTLSPFPLPANRNIVSYSSSSRSGVTFDWAGIDTAVQTELKKDPSTGITDPDSTVADAEGLARLNYIRGVRTAESDTTLNFRARRVIMGDSINSAPVLKGTPNAQILDASYQSFYSTNAARTPTVYLGTNDGMLHAFRAAESASNTSNGQEIFAYVPRAVSLKLNKLTDPGYVKEAYVDGAMAVDEARIYKLASDSVEWGTALVSGMGGGAKGLFALDVTTPETFGPSNVLWEFTNADDADMGNLLAEPKIVKLATAGNGNASPAYKWYAMVTSGYNNYNGGGSADKQFLFLISLEKETGDPWVLGTNYFKIQADNSAYTTANNGATGLGMPGVAVGIYGNALFAYAGDLQGNLWRFDLRGDSTTWTGSTPAKVLFIAKNAAGTATQPITVIPAVTLNVRGGYQIGFGTGKFMEPSDGLNSSAAQQSLYGIWDNDDGNTFERVATGGPPVTINGLITRTLTVTAGSPTVAITGNFFGYGTSVTVSDNQYRGWSADFPTTMERVAVDPVMSNGLMAVNSTIPGGDPCSATGGAHKYRYNPMTGISFDSTGSGSSSGYLASPIIIEEGDSVWTARSASGRYVVTMKGTGINPGTATGTGSESTNITVVAGRISWREITNFQ